MQGKDIFCLLVLLWVGHSGASQQLMSDDLVHRLEALELKQRQNEAEIVRLKEGAKKQSDIIRLQSESINSLRAESVAQKCTIGELLNLIRQNGADIGSVRRAIPSEARIQELVKASRCLNMTESCKNRRSNVARQVNPVNAAFTVYNDVGMLPQPGEVILFNKVITNEGDAYSAETGMFTCPQDGVYLFSFTVGEVGVNFIWADLMVKGVETLEAAAETFHDAQDLQGASTAVLRLNAGDLVWVAAAKLTGQHIPGGGRLTSFTGVYLYD